MTNAGMFTTEGDVDPLGIRAAERLIADQICHAATYLNQTPSTNTLALADLQQGKLGTEHCPKLYLADRQTAGRGRHGRTWVSSQGSLTLSLVVDRQRRHDRKTKLTSLAVGVAVARALEFEFAPRKTSLKWPNDVYIGGGKVAGILLETTQMASDKTVIGVGVNVEQTPDLGGEVRDKFVDNVAPRKVCSLAQVVGHRIHRYELLVPIVVSILRAIAELDGFPDDLVTEFRSRCLLTGQKIRFRQGNRDCEGLCRGVSDDGELVVETDGATRRLQSGEAQLVRVTAT